jgi:16S rRNA (guanine(966)-N(2))-methyltransferase RsmD
MRVIGGEFRSRRLVSVPGMDTRPTPDRLRETLFNILLPVIEDAVFFDAYAGTGAVGIEALSRGARQAVFLEKDKHAVEVIRQNLDSLEISGRARVTKGSAVLHLAESKDAIVFIDPPYDQEKEYEAVYEVMGSHPPKLLIVQHSSRWISPERCGRMERTRVVRQGDNALSFYRLP